MAAPSQGNYEYYFSWKNYSAGKPREGAVYLWSGKKVGVGKNGFHEIIKHLNSIPDKSAVYIFPTLAPFRYEGSGKHGDDLYPFYEYLDELWHVEKVKKLNLIFTNKDQNGHTLKGL